MADSCDVANYFIKWSMAKNTPLKRINIECLVYMAYGWNWAINETSLTTDKPYAFKGGPFFDKLHYAFNSYRLESRVYYKIDSWQTYFYRYDSKPGFFKRLFTKKHRLSTSEIEVIRRVAEVYDGMSTSQFAHHGLAPDTPWHQTYHDKRKLYDVPQIPDELIKEYFVSLASI